MKDLHIQIIAVILAVCCIGYLLIIGLSADTETSESTGLIVQQPIVEETKKSESIKNASSSTGKERDLFAFLNNFDESDPNYRKRRLSTKVSVHDFPDLRINKVYLSGGRVSELSITNLSDSVLVIDMLKYRVTDQSSVILYEGYIPIEHDRDRFGDAIDEFWPNQARKVKIGTMNNPVLEDNEELILWVTRK